MASIDKPDPGSSQPLKDELPTGELRDLDTAASISAEPPVPDTKSPNSNSSPSTTTDVSTAPSHQSPAPSSSSSYTAFANPPPKKFSAVNINKRFFQKTSTSSSVLSASSSNPSTIKTGSSARMSAHSLVLSCLDMPLTSPTRCSTVHLTFEARHGQAYIHSTTTHNHRFYLVAPFFGHSPGFFNNAYFIQCTPIATTCVRIRRTPISSRWESRSAPASALHSIHSIINKKGRFYDKTSLGNIKAHARRAIHRQC